MGQVRAEISPISPEGDMEVKFLQVWPAVTRRVAEMAAGWQAPCLAEIVFQAEIEDDEQIN